jgi:CDP-diglyceride synthetase
MGPLFENFGGSYHVGVETGIVLGLFLASGVVIADVPARLLGNRVGRRNCGEKPA